MTPPYETRRQFLAQLSALGLGSSVLSEALSAQVEPSTDRPAANRITPEMLRGALALAGLGFTQEEQKALLRTASQNLERYEELRALQIPNDVSPPFYFSPLVPGMKVDRNRAPFVPGKPRVRRPSKLDDVAFWPVVELAELLRTRQLTSLELTEMYLHRLHTYNAKVNCVVTFLDDLARTQAREADAQIAAGRYKGPLHGVPWGCKDIIAVKGYRTTWGSGAFKDQHIESDASVVEMLRDAGAVLLAKLASGELAGGDQWWGGQTRNPWLNQQGSYGSSAGPASATAAGLVAFAIGSETSGSILHPSSRCGCTGLRPTFGRVSRHGVMGLSWTQDRLGPICRYAEDCALVLNTIARPDDLDLSVSDIPFNWNANEPIRHTRVGYLKECFEATKDPTTRENNNKTLDQIRALGLSPVPLTLPDWSFDTAGMGVESAVFFDAFVRTGQYRRMTNPSRAAGMRAARLVPAVEFLQAQRARAMMMAKLAEATEAVDIYLAPADRSVTGADPDKTGAAAAPDSTPPPPPGPTLRHFNMANLAGYPALSFPNGFNPDGTPGSIILYGRPFTESKILGLARALQDSSILYRKSPDLDSQPDIPLTSQA